MADNISIPVVSSATIATDEVGGVNYQRVKLVDGTDEGTEVISGDTASGLDVDVTRIGGVDVATEEQSQVGLRNGCVRTSLELANDLLMPEPDSAIRTGSRVMVGGMADPDNSLTIKPLLGDTGNGLDVDVTRLKLHFDDPKAPDDKVAVCDTYGRQRVVVEDSAVHIQGNDIIKPTGYVDIATDFDGRLILSGYSSEIPVAVTGGGIGAHITTDLYDINNNLIYVNKAWLNAASSGDNAVVAAVSNKIIRVISLSLSAAEAVNAKFISGAGGSSLAGPYYLTTNSLVVLPLNQYGWFETAASAGLYLNLSASVAVNGCLTYILD
jgi:hypothetical protein